MKTVLHKRLIFGLFIFVLLMATLSSIAQTVATFTTTGTYTWICPSGVTAVTVETWGAGGAGGGSTGANGNTRYGGGGGGGGYNTLASVPVIPGTAYSYTVGAGGIAVFIADGNNGGNSSFNSLVIATGGTGGKLGISGGGGVGGSGGIGLRTGGNGASGSSGGGSGGGGGGAGSTAAGNNGGTPNGGAGGAIGGGAGGNGANSGNTDGGSGVIIGGGGGGGRSKSGGTNTTGGAGANGQVKLTYAGSSCGSTNTAIIATPGTTTYNWSALNWSLGHVPTACESAEVILNISTATASDVTTLNLDVDFTVVNMTMKNTSSDPYVHIFQSSGLRTINITGDFNINSPGGNIFNRTAFSNQLITTINGNLTLGNAVRGATEGHSAIGSNGTTPDQTYVLKGNMTFNPRGYTTDEWTKFIFDKAGTQYLYNYTTPQPTPYVQGVGDTIQPVLFEKLVVGNTNASNLIFAGTSFDAYIELQGRGGVIIGTNSTLDLPANYSINLLTDPGYLPAYFNMLSGSKLKLGGDRTISPNAIIYGVPGSNFPGSFSPYTFDPTSTVDYYGNNTITQTIYDVPAYANLIASNGSGSGRAQKITTAPVTVNTSFNINALADVTLGTLGSSTQTVACAGPLNIQATGGLYCNANVVSGAGAFAMSNGSYLGMGHAQGISLLGNATGNIQMTGGRNYNTTGNYIYNGQVNQVTGNGLPSTINELTTDNPLTVANSQNVLANGIALLKQGTFDILGTTFTSNGINGILNSTGGKMKANQGIVEMKGTSGTAQNLSGNWFVNKNISTLINANTKGITVAAVSADTLLISSALLYGAVTGSVITTNDNLTLLSRDTATARFGEIVLGSGNSINGKVNIERYLFARKSWRLLAAPVANATAPFIKDAWREAGSMASTGYGTQITGPYGAAAGMDVYTQRASMKSYNAASNVYTDVSNTNTTKIANGLGYYIFVRGDRAVPLSGAAAATILRIKGDLLTGTQPAVNIPAGMFQTFANPYPSRIDFRTVAKSSINSSFIIWNPNSAGSYNVGAFETYSLSGGNYVKVPGGTIHNFIESGEAVFVQSNAGAGTVTVKEADKVGGSLAVSRSAGETRTGNTNPTLEINLYAKDVDGSSYLADGVLMNFDDGYSDAVDNMDTRKIANTADNLSIKNGNFNLVIESRPNIVASDTIFMNLTGTRISTYRFQINPSVLTNNALKAFLNDKFLGTQTPISLSEITNYIFDITADAASKVANRFTITFKQVPPMRFSNITALRNTDNTASIQWNTENENNINYYNIEHSIDAVNFSPVASQIPAANNFGNATYNYIHADAIMGNNWYRVKANAITGPAQYTSMVKLEAVAIVEKPSISIYPNPATAGNVAIYFKNKTAGNYELRIVNNSGQIILLEKVNVNTANFIKHLNVKAATGLYTFIVVDENKKTQTLNFILK